MLQKYQYELSEYEINFILFGTNSIFHNAGLSIYSLTGEYINRHKMQFVKDDFEQIKLCSFEDRLQFASDNLRSAFNELLSDAKNTIQNLALSVGRQGVLFSHTNLISDMKPHIHRQVYATEILPCVTIHYRITESELAKFRFWDKVTSEQAIKHDLCRRDAINEWCKSGEGYDFVLPHTKNVVIFDSALHPHCIVHTDALNVYFIFDNVKLKDPSIFNGLPILLHE